MALFNIGGEENASDISSVTGKEINAESGRADPVVLEEGNISPPRGTGR